MQVPPLVSAIIIFLNAEPFLVEAIESVLVQTYPHWELLLVDDGSTDGSSQIAQQYAAQHPAQIRCLEHPGNENRGMSATRNLGIRHARGEFVAFLDADDVWLPEKLAYQVSLMEAYPEVGMVYGNTLYWYSWANHPAGQDAMPNLGVPPNTVHPPPGLLSHFLKGRVAVPCTCSLLIRRAALERVGGFEETFRGMYEDQAFYAKMCLAETIFVSDRCLDWYRQHPASNCHVTALSGQVRQVRLHFLHWLVDYLTVHRVEDTALWLALRQEIWLLRPHRRAASEKAYARIRWLKKWVLRLEGWFLPFAIRQRLWKVSGQR